jgi:hypothetical protein
VRLAFESADNLLLPANHPSSETKHTQDQLLALKLEREIVLSVLKCYLQRTYISARYGEQNYLGNFNIFISHK